VSAIRFGKILRFPWAKKNCCSFFVADEPPRATHYGVSSRPHLPLESTYFSYADLKSVY